MSHIKTAAKKKMPPEQKLSSEGKVAQKQAQPVQELNVKSTVQNGAHIKTASEKTENKNNVGETLNTETSTGEKSASEKKGSEKKQDSKSGSDKFRSEKLGYDRFGYDSLARQTLDLWREQLAHFLNNPEAMKDMSKGMDPAVGLLSPNMASLFTPLFSGGLSPLFSGGMDLWLMMLEQLGKTTGMNARSGTGKQNEQKTESQKEWSQNKESGQSRTEDRSAAASALSGASSYAVAQLASRVADLERRFAEFERVGKPVSQKPSGTKKHASPVVVAIKRVK